MALGKAIQQARQKKGLTQAKLAQSINEKPQIVNQYENGKAIPNGQVCVTSIYVILAEADGWNNFFYRLSQRWRSSLVLSCPVRRRRSNFRLGLVVVDASSSQLGPLP